MSDDAAKKAQIAKLKTELAGKTSMIRRVKQEGGDFMGLVAEIEAIKGKIKALGGDKKASKKGKAKGKTKGKKDNNNNNNNNSNNNKKKGGDDKKGGDSSATNDSNAAASASSSSSAASSSASSGNSKASQHHTQDVSVQTTNQVVGIFSHLKKDARSKKQLATSFSKHEKIHPAVIKMGLKFSQGILDSVNSRTVGMLDALKSFIEDVRIHDTSVFSLELGKLITVQINHLVTSRRHTLAMGNVINWLKSKISLLDTTLTHAQAKETLCRDIEYFVQEQIEMANAVIVDAALAKIQDGDVILTVSRYNVVEKLLMKLTEFVRLKGLNIRIVVTDSPPDFHGKRMIKKIASAGVHCTYAPLNALSYVMQDVTKVVIGASALASNGAVIAHAGTALVGMTAHAQGIPVLACVETYKFCERVQVDAIVENELSEVDHLVFSLENNEKSQPESARPEPETTSNVYCEPSSLGLIYDLTPAEFVTALVTEVGIIPPTSVPVILRETKDRTA